MPRRSVHEDGDPSLLDRAAFVASVDRRRRARTDRASRSFDAATVDSVAAEERPSDLFDDIRGNVPFRGLTVREQPLDDERCVAYAFCTAMDLLNLVNADAGTDSASSRFSVDHAFRRMDGRRAIKAGVTTVRDGITTEEVWPADAVEPVGDVEANRWRATVSDASTVPRKKLVAAICAELDAATPLVTFVPLFENLRTHAGGPYRPKGKAKTAHALCIVGYREPAAGEPGTWLALNSWGVAWGARGFAHLRWLDPHLSVEDAIVRVSTLERVQT